MRLMDKIGKLASIGKTREEMQEQITVIEVWSLWNHLTSRYHIITDTQILANFARDVDLKALLNEGLKVLQREAQVIEKELDSFGVALPESPPAKSSSPLNVEVMQDEFIFRSVFSGMASFMPTHFSSVLHATNARLREMFRAFLIDELDMYDRLMMYGQTKGWITNPPMYRV